MNLPTLTDKQLAALTARIDPNGGTPENLANQLIIAQAQKWADEDYISTANQLTESLKGQPQEVLDSIIDQLSAIPSS